MFSKLRKKLGLIFLKTPEVTIHATDEENSDDGDEGGDTKILPDGGRPENGGTIEAGERSERWYQRMERKVQDNTQKTNENNNLLTVLDFRTIWIARLLLAVLGSILSFIIAQQLLFPS